MMKRKSFKRDVLILIGVVLLDQISKIIVDSCFNLRESMVVIPDFFNITYVVNTGAAWSILQGKMSFLIAITYIAIIVMFMFYKNSRESDKLGKISLVLMMGGAIGNLIDRFMFDHVRDFLDFAIFGYEFPVFNFADVSLFLGVALLIICVFLESIGVFINEK